MLITTEPTDGTETRLNAPLRASHVTHTHTQNRFVFYLNTQSSELAQWENGPKFQCWF